MNDTEIIQEEFHNDSKIANDSKTKSVRNSIVGLRKLKSSEINNKVDSNTKISSEKRRSFFESNEVLFLKKIQSLEDQLQIQAQEIISLNLQISEKDLKFYESELCLKEKIRELESLKNQLENINNVNSSAMNSSINLNQHKISFEEKQDDYLFQIREQMQSINEFKEIIEHQEKVIKNLSQLKIENEKLNYLIIENEKSKQINPDYESILENLNEKNNQIQELLRERKIYEMNLSSSQNELYEVKEKLRKSEFEKKNLEFESRELEIKLREKTNEVKRKSSLLAQKTINKKHTTIQLAHIVKNLQQNEDFSDKSYDQEAFNILEKELDECKLEKENILNICKEQSERIFRLIEENSNLSKIIDNQQNSELNQKISELEKELKSFILREEAKNKEVLSLKSIISKLQNEINIINKLDSMNISKSESKPEMSKKIFSSQKMPRVLNFFSKGYQLKFKEKFTGIRISESNDSQNFSEKHLSLENKKDFTDNSIIGLNTKNDKFDSSYSFKTPVSLKKEKKFNSNRLNITQMTNEISSSKRRESTIIRKNEKDSEILLKKLENDNEILRKDICKLKEENEGLKKEVLNQKFKVDNEHEYITKSLNHLSKQFLYLKNSFDEYSSNSDD